MPKVHRKGDKNTGHTCWPPIAANAGSPDSFVNGKAQVRVGDAYLQHCCGSSCHLATAQLGSSTHFTNGKKTVRQGDKVSCDILCFANECSPDKSVGG